MIHIHSSHEISNDNGERVVNFATSKYLIVNITMFLHCNIHKYIRTFPMGKCTIRLIMSW